MALETTVVLAQIDQLIERCGVEVGVIPRADAWGNESDSWIVAHSTACLALLDRLAGPESAYRRAAQEKRDEGYPLASNYTLAHFFGVLLAFRADVEAGFTQRLQEIVHADVFGDFLEMADELQKKGYKDPAAVLAGSVLEEHLRNLAQKNGVAITDATGNPPKPSRVNDALKAATVYSNLEHKSVIAWFDLRNDAAHGHRDNYDDRQVAALIRDVRDFMIRHPA
jgi:hypothetical protein